MDDEASVGVGGGTGWTPDPSPGSSAAARPLRWAMDPRPWLVTVVRLAGLLIMVAALPGVGRALDALLSYLWFWNWNFLNAVGRANLTNFGSDRIFFAPLGSVAQFAAGLWMFRRGRRLVACLAPPDGSSCAHCGYDLRGSATGRCPECGRLTPPRRPA